MAGNTARPGNPATYSVIIDAQLDSFGGGVGEHIGQGA
jgi:hypothetical protein